MNQKITAAVECVTPDMAKSYLATMKDNRKPSAATVKKYADDMKNGRWMVSGQGIIFDEDGRLADGQHRLLATIESGCSASFLVIRNEPRDSFIHDRGRVRTMKNTMEVLGKEPWKSSHPVCGAVNALYVLSHSDSHYFASDAAIINFIDDNEEILYKAYSMVKSSASLARRAGVIAALFCCIFNKKDEEKLREFFKVVSEGVSYGAGDSPALVLRRTFEYHQKNYQRCNGTDNHKFYTYTTLKAINDYFAGNIRKQNYTVTQNNNKYDFEIVERLLLPKYFD